MRTNTFTIDFLRLPYGSRLIAVDMYARVTLVDKRDGSYQPFVTWRYDDNGYHYSGRYYDNEPEAHKNWQQRIAAVTGQHAEVE